MKYYRYDPKTKELTSSYEPVLNHNNNPLMEIHSTAVVPDVDKDGYAQIFNGDSWEYITDNRDKTYYLNGELVVFALGDEITAEMSLSQYTDAQLLEQAKEAKKAAYTVAKFLSIGGVIYPTHREDIIKYRDATDVAEALSEETVDFNTGSGKVNMTIAEARAAIKTLSRKSRDDYWAEDNFMIAVDNAASISELNQL